MTDAAVSTAVAAAAASGQVEAISAQALGTAAQRAARVRARARDGQVVALSILVASGEIARMDATLIP